MFSGSSGSLRSSGGCGAFQQAVLLSFVLPLWLAPLCLANDTQTGSEVIAGHPVTEKQQADPATPMEYDDYQDLIKAVHSMRKEETNPERLCGLDSYCITLWRQGKLKVYRDGRVITGDFNADGEADTAFVLEKDRVEPGAAPVKDFSVSITTRAHGVGKVLFHELIPEARNVVDFYWDKDAQELIIDTGGRVVKTTSQSSSFGPGNDYQLSKTYKIVAVVDWDAEARRFELSFPVHKMISSRQKSKSRSTFKSDAK